MTPKSFLYLAVAAALSVLFAIVSYASNNQWSTGKAAGDKLFPSLSNDLSKVTSIGIVQGEESLTLEKAGATWGVKDRGGYPVDFAKVRTILVGLSEAELLEGKTRRSDRYAALELEDPASKGAKSKLVRLTGDKGTVLAEVVLGKKKFEVIGAGKSGTYVRKPGDPQTWLTNTELNASISAKEWMRTNILTLDAAKISRVSIEMPGEQPLVIARDGDGADSKVAFVGFPPADKKLKEAGAADATTRAIASIDLEDVRKVDAAPKGGGVTVVKVESKDQPSVILSLRKDGETNWLSLTATGDGEAKAAAEELAARTKGWEYKIADFKANAILKKRADLLEPPPEPAPPAEPKKK
jgi:hypothetical protein